MKKGFTLIELIIVSLIIAILSVTAIPTYNGYISRTSDNVCSHTASIVLTSIVNYINANGNITPGTYDMDSINALMGNYQVRIPEGYSAEIIIIDVNDITVIVQNNVYLGTAQLEI